MIHLKYSNFEVATMKIGGVKLFFFLFPNQTYGGYLASSPLRKQKGLSFFFLFIFTNAIKCNEPTKQFQQLYKYSMLSFIRARQ
jgi:hypothetical protein